MLTSATSGEKQNSMFFNYLPLVALVSTFGQPHTYIWNQLDKFYLISTNCSQESGARVRFFYWQKRKTNFIIIFATGGANEHFQTLSCIYFESAQQVL